MSSMVLLILEQTKNMRLLLISNSTNAGESYLEHPLEQIKSFLGTAAVNAIFVPYAGVTISFDDYTRRVRERFREIGHDITSVHELANPVEAIENAPAIIVGGGNTFQLIKMMHDHGLTGAIRNKVLQGTPFIGWSAGSNIACPSIRTTNDMPIVYPPSFEALGLLPIQLNPHYVDPEPGGPHMGETREQRIAEFHQLNHEVVVGIREGAMLWVEGRHMSLRGRHGGVLFRRGSRPDLAPGADLSYLLDGLA